MPGPSSARLLTILRPRMRGPTSLRRKPAPPVPLRGTRGADCSRRCAPEALADARYASQLPLPRLPASASVRYVMVPVRGSVVELSWTNSSGWLSAQAMPARRATASAVPPAPLSALVERPGKSIANNTPALATAAGEGEEERVGVDEREREMPGPRLAVGEAVARGVDTGVALPEVEDVRVRAGVRVRLVLAVPVALVEGVTVWLGDAVWLAVLDAVVLALLVVLVVRVAVCVAVRERVSLKVIVGVRVDDVEGVPAGVLEMDAPVLMLAVTEAVMLGVCDAEGLPVLVSLALGEAEPVCVPLKEPVPVTLAVCEMLGMAE